MTAAEYRKRLADGTLEQSLSHRKTDKRATPEADFQEQVIEHARALGWRVAHFRPALTEKGWRTPVSADGAGFPDLVLVRDRVIFAELKSESGTLSDDQAEWLTALRYANAEEHVWRRGDWEAIEEALR
jgi:hypothetical protein